jgi:hypothetical protein
VRRRLSVNLEYGHIPCSLRVPRPHSASSAAGWRGVAAASRQLALCSILLLRCLNRICELEGKGALTQAAANLCRHFLLIVAVLLKPQGEHCGRSGSQLRLCACFAPARAPRPPRRARWRRRIPRRRLTRCRREAVSRRSPCDTARLVSQDTPDSAHGVDKAAAAAAAVAAAVAAAAAAAAAASTLG